MAASHAFLLARRASAVLVSILLAAGLALAVAPAASANGYPRCTPAMFTGGTVSDTSPSAGLGVMTISGDVSTAGNVLCDGQLVVAAGTTATVHLGDLANLTVYALDATSALDNQGTLTITGSGTLTLTGLSSTGIDNSGTLTVSGGTVTATGGEVGGGDGIRNSGLLAVTSGVITAEGGAEHGDVDADGGDGIRNSGTLAISGGTVTATGGHGDSHGGHGIHNGSTMTVVGGSLTATGGDSGTYGGDGIRNDNGATLVTTAVPTLLPGAAEYDGLPARNYSQIVMPVSPSAPYAGFSAGEAQAMIDANNDTVTPRVLYFFDTAPALGLRSPTHALRTPLLRIAATNTTVGALLDVLGGVSASWPKASSDVTFTGWYDAGGTKYGSGDTRLISSLDTPNFYAHWSAGQQSSQPPSQPSTSSSTQTTATAAATTTTATPEPTPPATSAFTPTNNVDDPYTFTSSAAPSAPALPTTSSANDGGFSQLNLSHLSIQQSSDFTATATGFMPGTVADFYLWSVPVYLGSAIADVHGVAVLRVTLEPAYVGEHHVQVVGTGLQGQPRNLAQAITITPPPTLAETGLGAAWLLGPALLLLLLGVGLFRAAGRRPAHRH